MTDTPTDKKLSERFVAEAKTVNAAVRLLRHTGGAPSPHVAISADGEIGLSWVAGKDRLEMMVQPEDERIVWCVKAGDAYPGHLQGDEPWAVDGFKKAGSSVANFWEGSDRLAESHPSTGAFKLGDFIQKKSGSSWRGKVVGFYSTNLTPRGYCVESAYESGSVQLYPEAALVAGAFDADHPSAIREAVEGEREACAKIADKRADPTNNDCERLSFDGSTGALECSLSHRGDCLCQEHQEEAEAIAAAIRARGEEKGQ